MVYRSCGMQGIAGYIYATVRQMVLKMWERVTVSRLFEIPLNLPQLMAPGLNGLNYPGVAPFRTTAKWCARFYAKNADICHLHKSIIRTPWRRAVFTLLAPFPAAPRARAGGGVRRGGRGPGERGERHVTCRRGGAVDVVAV